MDFHCVWFLQQSFYVAGYMVFHAQGAGGTYTLTLAAARTLCASKGAKLATLAQLQAAWDLGMDVCACGWLDDGSARFPIQWPNSDCGSEPAGLRTWVHDTNRLFNAYCFK